MFIKFRYSHSLNNAQSITCRCKYNELSSNFHIHYTKKSKKKYFSIAISKNICNFAYEFSIKNIAGIIEEQKNNGALIIVSAHSKELLLSFCDEIFYMDDGRIIKNEKIQQTDNK